MPTLPGGPSGCWRSWSGSPGEGKHEDLNQLDELANMIRIVPLRLGQTCLTQF